MPKITINLMDFYKLFELQGGLKNSELVILLEKFNLIPLEKAIILECKNLKFFFIMRKFISLAVKK